MSTKLNLHDIAQSGATDGQAPIRNTSLGKFIPGDAGSGGGALVGDIVFFGKNANDASVTTTYNHSLGVIPQVIFIRAHYTSGSATGFGSEGNYTNGENTCAYTGSANGANGFRNNRCVVLTSSPGAETTGYITNVTATTFDIVWAKTGSPGSLDFDLSCTCVAGGGGAGGGAMYNTKTIKTAGIDYQAGANGGFISAFCSNGASFTSLIIYADSNPTPTTIVARNAGYTDASAYHAGASAVILPNEYYRVDFQGTGTVLFYESVI